MTDESAVVTSSETLTSVEDFSLVGDDSDKGVDESGVVSVVSGDVSESEVASLPDSDALLELSVSDGKVVFSAKSEVRPSEDFSDAGEDSADVSVTAPEDSSLEELASPAMVVVSMPEETASLAETSDDKGGSEEEGSADETTETSELWDVTSDGRADSPLPSPSVDQIGEPVTLSSVVSDDSKETKSDASLVPEGTSDDGSSLSIRPSELKLERSLAEVTKLWSSIPGDDPDPSNSVENICTP